MRWPNNWKQGVRKKLAKQTQTVYLDYAASTPVRASVASRMAVTLAEGCVNPSSAHGPGRQAAARITQAAEAVGALINADPKDIVWTSGATESINLALKGIVEFYGGGHVVSVVTEHRATLDVLTWLEKQSTRVTRLGVDGAGRIDLDELAQALTDETRCVSIMHVNNETGVIQDIAAIGALCADKGIVLHVDAAQSLGKLAIDVQAMQIGMLSVSAHKIGGPQGMGALYIRRRPRVPLSAQIHGGGQQHNRRSGTLPVHQIVGFGEACRLACAERPDMQLQLRSHNDQLWQRLAAVDGIVRNSMPDGAPHILSVSVPGVHGAALLAGLTEGVPALAVSSGSACSAARAQSSYVLRAMGRTPALAAATVRFSLGATTTTEAIETAAKRTVAEVKRLRVMAPRRCAVSV